ncbi:MAG TPA: hypothetical protein PKA49_06470 [Tepidiformaceae bacterium]|nr:hypothetical protein [Tepidiformaceae bacterium]
MTTPERPWLARAIAEGIEQRICFSFHCWPCSGKAIALLMRAAARQLGEPPERDEKVTEARIHAIAEGLAELPEPPYFVRDGAFEREVRFILGRAIFAYRGGEYAETRLVPLFAGQWAGAVLERMKAHSAAVRRRQAENAAREHERAALGQQRREERAARHIERMRAQAEYNRRWYAARDGTDTSV